MSVLDESGILEERRDNRPRSNTWPLPDPSEFTKPERDVDQPSLKQLSTSEGPKKSSRKNAWGNLSYADLITQAIQSSSEQRLTLSQIYDWMVNTVPYFRDKGDSNSSAGWKNSIRHNLSLHSKFVRVQNEGNGKSSWWMLNPDAKGGKTSRRRSGSLDSAPKSEKKRGRSRKEKIKEEDGDSPSSPRLSVSRARDANRASSPGNVSPTNSSSSDSLLTIPETESPLPFPLGDSFARPRTSSNASTVSSLGGRLSPIPAHGDELELCGEDPMPPNNFSMVNNPNSAADELSQMADSMTLNSFAAENNNRLKQTLTPVQPQLLPSEPHSDISGMAVSNSITSSISSNSFDTGYNSSGYLQPIQHPQQSLSPEILPPQTIAAPQPVFGNLRSYSQAPLQQSHYQRNFRQELSAPRQSSTPVRVNNIYCEDQDMEVQQTPENLYQNFHATGFANSNPCVNGLPQNHQSFNYIAEPRYLQQQQQQQVTPASLMMQQENGLHPLHQQGNPFNREFRTTNNNQLEFMNEKFPSDLELDMDNFNGDLDCDIERIIYDELKDGGFDINIEQFFNQIPNVGELRSGLY